MAFVEQIAGTTFPAISLTVNSFLKYLIFKLKIKKKTYIGNPKIEHLKFAALVTNFMHNSSSFSKLSEPYSFFSLSNSIVASNIY